MTQDKQGMEKLDDAPVCEAMITAGTTSVPVMTETTQQEPLLPSQILPDLTPTPPLEQGTDTDDYSAPRRLLSEASFGSFSMDKEGSEFADVAPNELPQGFNTTRIDRERNGDNNPHQNEILERSQHEQEGQKILSGQDQQE